MWQIHDLAWKRGREETGESQEERDEVTIITTVASTERPKGRL